MVEMRVFGLTIDPQTKTPIVILREMDGDVVLPAAVRRNPHGSESLRG